MKQESVCPWWMGYLLANPLRKLYQNPDKIVAPYLKAGMKVVDYGSAMGYFSLPMAKAVGDIGKVYCFDIQQKMLDSLVKRAGKSNLKNIIEPRLINSGKDVFGNLKSSIDFSLLFAVVHEVPDKENLFNNLSLIMKQGGKILFSEPKGHVTIESFKDSVSAAEKAGFKSLEEINISGGISALLEKE